MRIEEIGKEPAVPAPKPILDDVGIRGWREYARSAAAALYAVHRVRITGSSHARHAQRHNETEWRHIRLGRSSKALMRDRAGAEGSKNTKIRFRKCEEAIRFLDRCGV
jgi:hypothetical protein